MNVSESNHVASESPTAVAALAAAPEYARCSECGAAVDQVQRFCVSCGARQRHVHDPAARFLSQATARSRTATRSLGGEGTVAERRRVPGVLVALLLALIPVTLAVGVVVGRSSNNGDARLIRELSASQAQVAAASHSAATAPAAAPTIAATRSSAPRRRAARHSAAKKAATANPNTSKAPSTINGTASSAQQKQGAAIVSKLQHTNGTSYLNQLPSQVVVP